MISKGNFGEAGTHPIIRTGRLEDSPEGRPSNRIWVVAPSLNSISSEGRTVRLEPKVMGVLQCLAKHPGETLSKEQLFQAVWPNIVVTEDVLKRCIAELRRAFDDDAREPRIIETTSKRGYRLVAPVTARSASPTAAETAVSNSIVVMPFLNMSGDAENEYFADGITEEIINALAQIVDLHVVPRSSAFSFKAVVRWLIDRNLDDGPSEAKADEALPEAEASRKKIITLRKKQRTRRFLWAPFVATLVAALFRLGVLGSLSRLLHSFTI